MSVFRNALPAVCNYSCIGLLEGRQKVEHFRRKASKGEITEIKISELFTIQFDFLPFFLRAFHFFFPLI